jgi:hypothetical protein
MQAHQARHVLVNPEALLETALRRKCNSQRK